MTVHLLKGITLGQHECSEFISPPETHQTMQHKKSTRKPRTSRQQEIITPFLTTTRQRPAHEQGASTALHDPTFSPTTSFRGNKNERRQKRPNGKLSLQAVGINSSSPPPSDNTNLPSPGSIEQKGAYHHPSHSNNIHQPFSPWPREETDKQYRPSPSVSTYHHPSSRFSAQQPPSVNTNDNPHHSLFPTSTPSQSSTPGPQCPRDRPTRPSHDSRHLGISPCPSPYPHPPRPDLHCKPKKKTRTKIDREEGGLPTNGGRSGRYLSTSTLSPPFSSTCPKPPGQEQVGAQEQEPEATRTTEPEG